MRLDVVVDVLCVFESMLNNGIKYNLIITAVDLPRLLSANNSLYLKDKAKIKITMHPESLPQTKTTVLLYNIIMQA